MSQCARNVAQCFIHTRFEPSATKNKQMITKYEMISVTSQYMIPRVPVTPKIIKNCSFKNGPKHGEVLNDAQLYC